MTIPIHDNTPIEELATRYVIVRHNPANYTFGVIHEEIEDEMSDLYDRMYQRLGRYHSAVLIENAENIAKLMGVILIP